VKQTGIALVTGLVLMAAVSLLAVTAAGSMTLQRKQAANFQDRAIAEANALLAESWARAWLFSRHATERQSDCSDNCLLPPAINSGGALPHQPEFEGDGWWQSNGVPAGLDAVSGARLGTPATAGTAHWIIEEIHFHRPDASAPGVGYYRLLGRGQGRLPGSTVMVESLVARPWPAEFQPLDLPPTQSLNDFCGQFDESLACGMKGWRRRR
jgi:Tfp pilus assembly protein PilX